MRFFYLTALMLAGCPSVWSSTLITATSNCEIDQPGPVFTDSHTVTLFAPTNMINGLDCTSPYGSILFPSSVIDSINLLGPTGFHIAGLIDLNAATAVAYPASASLTIHLFSQDTYIPSGGSGVGFLSGLSGGIIGGDGSVNLVTPFGSCSSMACPMGPVPYQIAFVFGQPLTLTVTGDLILGINSVLGDFRDGDVTVAVGSMAVFDQNGNPISATFTPTPEPAAWLLSILALLLIVLVRQLNPKKNPLPTQACAD